MAKKKKMTIGLDEYIKANKKLAREEELARNAEADSQRPTSQEPQEV